MRQQPVQPPHARDAAAALSATANVPHLHHGNGWVAGSVRKELSLPASNTRIVAFR